MPNQRPENPGYSRSSPIFCILYSVFSFCCLASCLPHLARAQESTFEELARQAEANVDTNPAQAVSLFQKALALRPWWGEGWLYLGGSLYHLERYNDALEAFDKGIPLTRPLGTSWAFRGLCQFELRQFDKALRDIQKGEALGLGANRQFESVVRQHAALILIRSSFFDLALAQLEPLSNYSDNSPAVVEAAGLCALTLPLWPAELSRQKLAVVDLAGKALWAGTSRRSGDAVAAYRDLLATYPHETGVHYAHGLYLLESDQDAALSEFEEELRAHPSHWPSLLAYAALENKRGDAEHAVQAARTAAKSVPPSYLWLCHAEIGRAYLSMRSAEKAVPEFEAAVKQAPSNPQMHFYLEQSYRLAGNREAARKEKAEFIRLKALQDPATAASNDVN